MKTETCILILIGLALSTESSAAQSKSRADNKRGGLVMRETIISSVLPAEFAEFSDARSRHGGKADVDAALKLLSATQTKLRGERSKPRYDYDVVNAHAAAWKICLQMKANTKDETVRRRILDEWNRNLREESEEIPVQFAAAASSSTWSREFLTDDFWNLLRRSTKRRTIIAVCWILNLKGDDSDLKPLIQKEYSENSAELRGILHSYISSLDFRLKYHGDTTKNPGPAKDPPPLEID